MSAEHPETFFEAMCQWILASGPLVAAFGNNDAALASTKFWADATQPGPEPPFASYTNMDESRTPSGTDGDGFQIYICKGHFAWTVTASEKERAISLADLVGVTLDDAPLVFADGTLLEITYEGQADVEIRDPQHGTVVGYGRAATFVYVIQRMSVPRFVAPED